MRIPHTETGIADNTGHARQMIVPSGAPASRALSIVLRQLYAAACTGSAVDVMEVARIAWHVAHATALVRWRRDGRWRWVASHGTHAPTLLWQAAHGEASVTSRPLIDAEVQGVVWTSGQAEPGTLPQAPCLPRTTSCRISRRPWSCAGNGAVVPAPAIRLRAHRRHACGWPRCST
ncbi:hypothetical protein ACFSUI_19085 [Ralstonia solanacearum]